MEKKEQAQDEQQSKPRNNGTDSLNSSSTGREQEYYSSKQSSQDKEGSGDSGNQVTEKDIVDDSTFKIDREVVSKVAKDYYSSLYNGSHLEHSIPDSHRNSDQLQSASRRGLPKPDLAPIQPKIAVNDNMETPQDINDTRHLSSVQINMSDIQSPDQCQVSSKIGHITNKAAAAPHITILESQIEDGSGERPLEFDTPKSTAHKLVTRKLKMDTPEPGKLRIESEHDEDKKSVESDFEDFIRPQNSHPNLDSQNSKTGNKHMYTSEDQRKETDPNDMKAFSNSGHQFETNTARNQAQSDGNTDMLDYILGIEKPAPEVGRKVEEQKLPLKIDEEDISYKNDASSLFIENHDVKHVVDIHAMRFNPGSQSESAKSQNDLVSGTLRSSMPTMNNYDLEMKEGWMEKRSFNAPTMIGWQRKYCLIKNNKFIYYKNKEDEKIDGVIDFNLVTCMISVDKDSKETYVQSKQIGEFGVIFIQKLLMLLDQNSPKFNLYDTL